ncbi:hypothetical protein K435DRAFT_966840 [Dendrothele bispora CBS 962.96]|uniref:Uncharacterized protein n=1 Tax=Dendrothele bispora (strain CBS 962.96) TaxID=1314807 RepID=A0A4S8LYZ7_DENBC|nr:hypothetical protein K435DRAFT_966840 [Dendrothele bispora CBS 962.96]
MTDQQDKKELVEMLLPLTPNPSSKTGFKCGRNNVAQHIPLRTLVPQFFEGVYANIQPPLFHLGWHFEEQALEAAAKKHGLLVKQTRDPTSPCIWEPLINVHATLRKIAQHLKQEKIFDFPHLQYASVRSRNFVMISITTNYKGWLPNDEEIEALQGILCRTDEPVWDLYMYSQGWRRVSGNVERTRCPFLPPKKPATAA